MYNVNNEVSEGSSDLTVKNNTIDTPTCKFAGIVYISGWLNMDQSSALSRNLEDDLVVQSG